MKKLILVFFLILWMVALNVQGQTVKKEVPVTAGQTLEIDIKSGGSIEITGMKQLRVEIQAETEGSPIKNEDLKLEKTETGVHIQYSGSTGKKGVDFKVTVPEKFNLHIKTAGGDVRITGVEGTIKGKTMGGDLDFNKLKGTIDFKTMGGEIVLKDSDLDGRVKTMGGRVLLENVSGDVEGSTMGGNVVYNNVKSRDGKSNSEETRISTMGGDINISEALNGADVHTMGGQIRVRSARQFIKAKTMGGEIKIDSIDGWVEATTMGGDLEVSMTGNPEQGDRHVSLTSMGGDVTLTVPDGLSMDIQILLGLSKDHGDKYKIYSDFDLKQSVGDKFEDEGHNFKKVITASGTVKDGKHKIKIKTINGNVYLKKSK